LILSKKGLRLLMRQHIARFEHMAVRKSCMSACGFPNDPEGYGSNDQERLMLRELLMTKKVRDSGRSIISIFVRWVRMYEFESP